MPAQRILVLSYLRKLTVNIPFWYPVSRIADSIPFFLLIFCWAYRYIPIMITFETTYKTRTAMRTCGSSNGIFFDTCIIPRMMTKLVLHTKPDQYLLSLQQGPRLIYICGLTMMKADFRIAGRVKVVSADGDMAAKGNSWASRVETQTCSRRRGQLPKAGSLRNFGGGDGRCRRPLRL